MLTIGAVLSSTQVGEIDIGEEEQEEPEERRDNDDLQCVRRQSSRAMSSGAQHYAARRPIGDGVVVASH